MARIGEDKFKAGTNGLRKDGYFLDNGLKKELDYLMGAVKNDWDGVILIDGVEGGGKSILAQQVGYYLDPKLDVENIVFTGEEFIERATAIDEKYRVIIFDEAFAGLSSRAAMSSINKNITRMLMEIRQKNLFLILILPTFFELDRYAAIFRSRCLIHVKADHFQRGDWDMYGYTKKKNLYMYGKKYYNYRMVTRDIFGKFMAFSPVDQIKYKEKKQMSLRKAFEPEDRTKKYAGAIERKTLDTTLHIYNKRKQYGLKVVDIADLMGVNASTIANRVRKSRNMAAGMYLDKEDGDENVE